MTYRIPDSVAAPLQDMLCALIQKGDDSFDHILQDCEDEPLVHKYAVMFCCLLDPCAKLDRLDLEGKETAMACVLDVSLEVIERCRKNFEARVKKVWQRDHAAESASSPN